MTELYHLIRWTYLPYTQEESSNSVCVDSLTLPVTISIPTPYHIVSFTS